MKIFGDILPFLGFRTYAITDNGYPIPDEEMTEVYKAEDFPWISDCLVFEWFGWVVILFTTKIVRNPHAKKDNL